MAEYDNPDAPTEENTAQVKRNTDAMKDFLNAQKMRNKETDKQQRNYWDELKQQREQAAEHTEATEENTAATEGLYEKVKDLNEGLKETVEATEEHTQASEKLYDKVSDLNEAVEGNTESTDNAKTASEKLYKKVNDLNENLEGVKEEQEKPEARQSTFTGGAGMGGFDTAEADPNADPQFEYTMKEGVRQQRRERTLDERWEDYIEFLGQKFEDLDKRLGKVVDAVEDNSGGGFAGFFGGGKGGRGRGGRAKGFFNLLGKAGRGLSILGRIALPVSLLSILGSSFLPGIFGPSIQDRKESGESFFNTENNESLIGSFFNSRFGDYVKYAGAGAGIGSIIPGVGTAVGAGVGIGVAALIENWTSIKSFFQDMQNWSIEGTTDAIVQSIKNFSFSEDISKPLGNFLSGLKTDVIDPTVNYFKNASLSDYVKYAGAGAGIGSIIPGVGTAVGAGVGIGVAALIENWTSIKSFFQDMQNWSIEGTTDAIVQSIKNFSFSEDISKPLGNFLSGLKTDAIDPTVNYFKNASLSDIANDVKTGVLSIPFVPEIAATFTKLGEAGMKINKALFGKAVDMVSTNLEDYPNTKAFLSAIGTRATEYAGAIGQKATVIGRNIRDAAVGLWDAVTGTGQEDPADLGSPAYNVAQQAYEWAGRKAANLMATVRDAAIGVWDWKIPGNETTVGETAKSVYELASKKAGEIGTTISTAATDLWDWAFEPRFEGIESTEKGAQAKVVQSRVEKAASYVLSNVKSAAEGLWDWAFEPQFIDTEGSEKGSEARVVASRVERAASSILSGVKSTAVGLWDWAFVPSFEGVEGTEKGAEAKQVGGNVSKAASYVLSNVKSAATGLWDWAFEPKFEGVESTEKGAQAKIAQDTISNKASTILRTVQDVASGLWDWKSEPKFEGIMSTEKGTQAKLVQDKATSAVQTAIDKVTGFWDDLLARISNWSIGIDFSITDIRKKMDAFVKRLVNPVDEFFERNVGFSIFSSSEPKIQAIPEAAAVKNIASIEDSFGVAPASTQANTVKDWRDLPPGAERTKALNEFINNQRNKAQYAANNNDPANMVEDVVRKDARETTDRQRAKIVQNSGVGAPRNPHPPNINSIPMLPDDRGLAILSMYDWT